VIETEGHTVVGYREKPSLAYEVSMGIYAYDERALAHVPDSSPFQFPELVQRLVDAGEKVAAFRSEAEWFDIGTPEEHQRAVEAFEGSPEVFAT
jgi:NDP-mannose synthase